MAVEQSELQLPMSIVGYSDVGHLLTEAEAVDNFLRQAAIRETGTPMQLPKTSKLLDELVSVNQLNLLDAHDRNMLLNLLKAVRAKAPVIHMSFNNDPSPIFLQNLITWMRQQLHPFVLLQIGLNPSIGAGCVLRTTNRFFDFSLRHQFTEQRELLIRKLREGSANETSPVTPDTNAVQEVAVNETSVTSSAEAEEVQA
jgi:F0F1-type ATP synthase delta subunit